MENINKILAWVGVAGIVIVGVFLYSTVNDSVLGSAPSGLPSTVATTSSPTVGTTAVLVFATSTNCASRVISTRQDAIRILFSDYAGQTPSDTIGHVQAASTTVAYDSGIYGCNAVKIYSYATQVITVTETR